MLKTPENISQLVEADFKIINHLLEERGHEYSLAYIRMVCKGKRHNENIKNMAEKYLEIQTEANSKLIRLIS